MVEDFLLYEAILWERGRGYFLLDRHLRRLLKSAAYFQFRLDAGWAVHRLEELATTLTEPAHKVRLEASVDGEILLSLQKVKPVTPVTAAIADNPVDSGDPFLYHKTSKRTVYERALAAHAGAQDVILWNENKELTETCHANLVLEIDGRMLTPPHACGLLPGTYREYLLEQGKIQEESLPLQAINEADGLYLINSVRRWCRINLMD